MPPSAQKLFRLNPGRIAEDLYVLDPDRDERAPQICAETLLTLAQNNYRAPERSEDLQSPKRQRFALRSLALGRNFLAGHDHHRAGDNETTPEQYGAILATGDTFRGSAHLDLAQATLQGLVDPETQRGQHGAWLLRPFHESLLWYDARPKGREYSVRKVYMRGSGITMARLLSAPADPEAAALGRSAVEAIREALTAGSPFAEISNYLEKALPTDETWTNKRLPVEQDEIRAWDRGIDSRLNGLASQLCRHAEGVMQQGGASGAAQLWQLRTILALDLAVHVLRTAWDVTNTLQADRYLLLSFGGAPRAQDAVRQRSEDSYRRARTRLGEATVRTLARRMRELAEGRDPQDEREVVDWASEFAMRRSTGDADADSVSSQLSRLPRDAGDEDYLRIARLAAETADYGRSGEGFRVLLESVGMLAGTRYRYLTASPDLLAALVGALSAQMPMSSREFFAAVRREWGIVINQESAAETGLAAQLDGAGLERNARRAERIMSDAGLALGLSDRTTVVGERALRPRA